MLLRKKIAFLLSVTLVVISERQKTIVIDRYGNFHITDADTDMLIITNTDNDKKKINSPIPISRKGIHRYRYEKLLDTDTELSFLKK